MKRNYLAVLLGFVMLLSAGTGFAAEQKQTKKKYVIGVSLVSKDNQWWGTAGKFITQAAEAKGVELVLLWAAGNQEKQVKDIEDLIQRKVDGIIMGPVQQAGSTVAVDSVAEANIPIVTFGRRSNSKKANAEVFYNEAQFGINQVQAIAKDFPNGANIVYLFGPVGAGYAIQQYEDGFLKELKKFPKLKLLDTYKHENDTTALGMKNAEDALIRFSDVSVFAGCNDDMGFGAIRAIEAAGKGGKIKVYGSTGMPIGLQAINDGKMVFTNLKSTAAVTNKALDLMLKILKGEKVQKVNLIDPVIITKDNLLTLKDPGFSGTIDNPGTWKPAKK